MFELMCNVLFYGILSFLVIFLLFLLILKLSPPLNEYIFTLLLGLIGPKIVKKNEPHKIKLFSNLNDVVSCDPILAKSGRFRLLEIGAGAGANFKFYPENCNVITLDPNPYFKNEMDENKQKCQKEFKFEKHIQGKAEDMSALSDESIDVVVCTHVLCSIYEIRQSLSEIKRVLKKGGKFLYFEHVSYPRGSIMRIAQQLLNPIWKIIFCHCEVTKFTLEEIQKAKFDRVFNNHYDVPLGIEMGLIYYLTLQFVKPTVYGVAIK